MSLTLTDNIQQKRRTPWNHAKTRFLSLLLLENQREARARLLYIHQILKGTGLNPNSLFVLAGLYTKFGYIYRVKDRMGFYRYGLLPKGVRWLILFNQGFLSQRKGKKARFYRVSVNNILHEIIMMNHDDYSCFLPRLKQGGVGALVMAALARWEE
jgi:hypothetical protein